MVLTLPRLFVYLLRYCSGIGSRLLVRLGLKRLEKRKTTREGAALKRKRKLPVAGGSFHAGGA